MGWKHTAITALHRVGGLRLLEAFYGRSRLTVLAYHRVADPGEPGFVGFPGNASATPGEFAQQVEWIADRMNPVTLEQVAASVEGTDLPDRAVLVTFDDGYRDNLTAASPILDRYGVPAALFVATDHIGTADPFWWDLVAWRFATSDARRADLPILGTRAWSAPHRMAVEWISAAKALEEAVKLEAVDALAGVLGGGPPAAAFGSALLTWDDVRTLSDRGWAVGAHTCTHPILTRLSPDGAVAEVLGSVDRVRDEVRAPVMGFAYPNGQPGDFDRVARGAVADAGVPVAFSLVPGPARPSEVRADPLAVRRVYVHHGDDPARFAAKAAGVPRLVGRG